MNYWPAESCNLSECHEPLFSMIEDLSRTGARTAAIHYGADGWTTHHNVDLWRMSTPTDGSASWRLRPMGGGCGCAAIYGSIISTSLMLTFFVKKVIRL